MPREKPRTKKPRDARNQALEMRRIKVNPVFSREVDRAQPYFACFCGGRASRIKNAEITRARVKRVKERR